MAIESPRLDEAPGADVRPSSGSRTGDNTLCVEWMERGGVPAPGRRRARITAAGTGRGEVGSIVVRSGAAHTKLVAARGDAFTVVYRVKCSKLVGTAEPARPHACIRLQKHSQTR